MFFIYLFNHMDYTKTGNKIPIKMDELYYYVLRLLDSYTQLYNATGNPPKNNPFADVLYYSTEEGKIIEIPKDIQKKAIDDWYTVKRGVDIHDENDDNNDNNDYNNYPSTLINKNNVSEVTVKQKPKNIFVIIMILVAIFVSSYLLYSHMK
jgi:hypothetical protein